MLRVFGIVSLLLLMMVYCVCGYSIASDHSKYYSALSLNQLNLFYFFPPSFSLNTNYSLELKLELMLPHFTNMLIL